MSGISTYDPSVRAGEDISYLRPRGHCDRLTSVRGEYKSLPLHVSATTGRHQKMYSTPQRNTSLVYLSINWHKGICPSINIRV
jgi:hypothetical protein